MATLRELKGRIGSVASTEKITGAMKMISSAKMRKAEQALRRLVPFRSGIRGIIADLLSSDAEFTSPLTETRELRRICIIAFGSDDGLCGAYNANLSKFVQAHADALRAAIQAKGYSNQDNYTAVIVRRHDVWLDDDGNPREP